MAVQTAVDVFNPMLFLSENQTPLKLTAKNRYTRGTGKESSVFFGRNDYQHEAAKNRYTRGTGKESSVFFGRNDYQHEAVRQKTYSFYWPSWAEVSGEDLAAAGLWYTGESDEVKCFCCSTPIDNWKKGENPDERHRRENPDCRYLRGIDTTNVPLLSASVASNSLSDSGFGSLSHKTEADTRQATNQRKPGKLQKKRYGDMKDERNRFRTFEEGWPSDTPVTPKDIVKAGMYFSGEGSRVICPYCGIKVDKWYSTSIPIEEHAKKSAKCAFVKKQLGREAVMLDGSGHPSIHHNAAGHHHQGKDDPLSTPAASVVLSMGFSEVVVLHAMRKMKSKPEVEINVSNLLNVVCEMEDGPAASEEEENEDDQEEDEELYSEYPPEATPNEELKRKKQAAPSQKQSNKIIGSSTDNTRLEENKGGNQPINITGSYNLIVLNCSNISLSMPLTGAATASHTP